ncbi:uncharacterized protein LOC126375055 [Pectinophora gossypiella]|uniref:uncharacterized protein LOC126375055 n=1 Tax=Pectinophora gossypiella TaxID=13191 RepID=UPI00214E41CC|nr:uncharacterized protein LOC126375055 [Pectinophora gossypiella]
MSGDIDTVTLYEEYRLIERTDPEINGAWKGAHLLLFFLSFVFGSFCTFCFHVLMYLFDDKCVLFPKLLSIRDLRRSSSTSGIILDFIAHKDVDALPVDFVTTQWVDKSVCYLPTYVPLVSGICGLVWTTMFLMCSSGSRTLTGLQRPWRILPSVFIFSLAMAGLCIYTSIVTQYGLQELCTKLGEITGSSTCTYTINVATLAYERRIRGVYQATRLTMLSAWLHTACWVGAAALALARVILVVDFRLVRIRADLRGNVEKMLERHEKHIRTDEFWNKEDYTTANEMFRTLSNESVKVRFVNKGFGTDAYFKLSESTETLHYFSRKENYPSQLSLLPEEKLRLHLQNATINKEHKFIMKMLYDLVELISVSAESILTHGSGSLLSETVQRQYGKQVIEDVKSSEDIPSNVSRYRGVEVEDKEAKELATTFRQQLGLKLQQLPSDSPNTAQSTLVTPSTLTPYESYLNITPELEIALEKAKEKKSNLKNRSTQTDPVKKTISQKVQIASPNPSLKTLKGEKDDNSTDSDVPSQPSRGTEKKVSMATHITVLQEPGLKPVHEELKDEDMKVKFGEFVAGPSKPWHEKAPDIRDERAQIEKQPEDKKKRKEDESTPNQSNEQRSVDKARRKKEKQD